MAKDFRGRSRRFAAPAGGRSSGKSFVDASPEDRVAVLTVLSDHDQMTDLPEVRFFLELKRLTVRGYYTSKIGIHDELEYKGNRILQEFVGCDDQGLASS